MRERSRARVLILYTGGTVGMRQGRRGMEPVPGYFDEKIAGHPSLHDPSQPRFATFPSRSGRRIVYDVKSYDPLHDSVNLGRADWVRFANDIGKYYDEYDAFVIVHGTDTMAYTASALAFMLENLAKPVILTGAQIPLEQLRNDAADNLLGALGVAGHYGLPEVGLYFHHRLYRGCRVTKVDAMGLDAFSSPNLSPLVDVAIDVSVRWDVVLPPPEKPLVVRANLNPNVAALRLYPGITRAILENVLRPPLEGLVIESFGAGNAPNAPDREDLLGALREATDRGIVIVNVTQCLKGRVMPSYASGRALLDAGVVPGADMTVEAALTKLSWLLGLGLETETVRTLASRSLRGELTEYGDE